MIKSSRYVPLDSKKLIEAATIKIHNPADQANERAQSHQASDLEQAVRDKKIEDEIERMLNEAKEEADAIIREAKEQSDEQRRQAEQELAEWLEARRQEADKDIEAAVQAARDEAYQEGLAQGRQAAEEQYRQSIESAAKVLQDAHALKRDVIAEAEPFLLDLSTQIAEAIITRQLSLEPEWAIDLIRNVLSRERRKGQVTLCVSPEQFLIVREARDELSRVLDPQAELQIIPDSTVQGYGCVVRTDFGSLDARIDSQLTEVKQALLQVCAAEQGVEEA